MNRLLLFVMAVLAGGLGVLPAPAAELMKEAERAQFADGLYARGLYELAIHEYEALVRDFPDGAQAAQVLYRLGECYRQTGDLPGADRAYRMVFVKHPDSEFRFRAGFSRASLFLEIGDAAAAVTLFKQVLAIDPPADIRAATYYYLGDAQRQAGHPAEALKAFEEVVAKHAASTFHTYALLQLGQLIGPSPDVKAAPVAGLTTEQRTEKALTYFRQAAAKPATDRVGAEALFLMAELYFRNGDFEKSSETYRELSRRYPGDTRAVESRLQSGWAAQNAGRYADARRIAEEVLKATEGGGDRAAEWLYLKANAERQLMQGAAAVKTYGRLVAGHPASPFARAARYESALTHYKMGAFKEAVQQAAAVEGDAELKKDVYWLLAESYAALEQEEDAIQYYRLIVRDFAGSDIACDSMFRLAYYLQARKEYQEAARHYNSVAETCPQRDLAPKALFAAGFCLAKAGQHEEAVRDWDRLVQDYASSPLVEESLYQKAMSETRLRRDEQALASLADLLKRFPKSRFVTEAHYWQGVILMELGKPAEAETKLRQALDLKPEKEIREQAELYLAVVLHQQDKFKEAAPRIQALLAAATRDRLPAALLQWLAEYQCEQKQWAETVEAGRRLAEATTEPARQQAGWTLVGRGEMGRNARAAAVDAFKRALAIPARTAFAAEAALRLGDLHVELKQAADAGTYYRQAAGLAADDALLGIRVRAYAGLGYAAKAAGDLQDAGRFFMSVAVLYDDAELVSASLYEAAEAFGLLGQAEAQTRAEDELLERYPETAAAKKIAAQRGSELKSSP